MTEIGQFEIVSGKVFITDPCYAVDTWCQALIPNVKNGVWDAFIEYGAEDRVAILRVNHSSVSNTNFKWLPVEGEIGVDSGQAGVFDAKYYKIDDSVKGVERIHDEILCEDEPFYSMCCDRSLSAIQGGTIPYGAISSSGYGDGGYEAFISKDKNGKIIAICIEFISEEIED